MTHKTRLFSLLILVTCLVIGMPERSRAAARNNPPLILSIGGEGYLGNESYAWTEPGKPLQNLTHYGFNGAPIISPNNRYIAYLSIPRQQTDAMIKYHWGAAGVYPANIWILDLVTGQGTQIAEQPAGATFDMENGLHPSIQRSEPAWSPDSKQIAWTEFVPDASKQRLVVYDLATKKSRVLPINMTPPEEYTSQLFWSTPGIALVYHPLVNDEYGPFTAQVIDPDGKLLFSDPLNGPVVLRWVKDGDKEYLCVPDSLGYDYISGPVTTVDVATGQKTSNASEQELYSLSAPDGLSLMQTKVSDYQAAWQLLIPGQQPVFLTDADFGDVDGFPGVLYNAAISSDGRQVAYFKDNQLFIYRDGKTLTIPINVKGTIQGITWGAMGWRVHHAPTDGS